jgi:steroid delta-isomerase-like uncharacterized protein
MASSAQEQNKQVVRQFFDAFDRHYTEGIEQLVSSTNYSFHSVDMPPPINWNEHKQFIVAITNAFPDVHHDIVDLVAEGKDKVEARFDATAITHKGEFESSIPPTGKKVSFGGMNFFTIIDGKVAEEWVIVDMLALMQQIGAIHAPNASSSSSSSSSSAASS